MSGEDFWRMMASELAGWLSEAHFRDQRKAWQAQAALRRYEEAKAANRPHVEQQTLGGGTA